MKDIKMNIPFKDGQTIKGKINYHSSKVSINRWFDFTVIATNANYLTVKCVDKNIPSQIHYYNGMVFTVPYNPKTWKA